MDAETRREADSGRRELLERFRQLVRRRAHLSTTNRVAKAVHVADEMVRVATDLQTFSRGPLDKKNLKYAEYYRAVTLSLYSLLQADFVGSREYATKAGDLAGYFRKSLRFFPNYFFDEIDIGAYGTYISGVESFRLGKFERAASMFEKWSWLNRHRADTGDATYDSNLFMGKVARLLAKIKDGSKCPEYWKQAEEAIYSPSLSLPRTARALWDLVEPLKSCALGGEDGIAGGKQSVAMIINKIRDQWRLSSPSAPLKGAQRSSSLEEEIRLPTCLDVFESREISEDCWGFVLKLALRNALLLRADYLNLVVQRRQYRETPQATLSGLALEQLNDIDLSNYLRKLYDNVKEKADQRHLASALIFWFNARAAIRQGNRSQAEALARDFFREFRATPHIVQVNSCRRITDTSAGKSQYEILFDRLWHQPRKKLTLECGVPAVVGEMMYLQPRWNKSLKLQYRVRDLNGEPIRSSMPQWMTLFASWASGLGPVKGDTFIRWCAQIPASRRSTVLRLLTIFMYFDDQKVRDHWNNLIQVLPKDYLSAGTIYVALGRAAKSGNAQLISLKQVLTLLPQYAETNFKTAFRSEEALRDEDSSVESIVFVDDFIGTGQQATSFLSDVLERFPWLRTRKIMFCAVAGFESAVISLVSAVEPLGIKVMVSQIIGEDMRAFSESTPLWESNEERLEAREWCRQLGATLLSDQMDARFEHALGWKGSEGLIAFHYNTPNNTLPLFWARGHVNGREWLPLFPRF